MRGNFFTVDELVCSYFNRQEYSIFYSAAFIHTFDRAFSSSCANLNAAKVNKKPLRRCLCSIVDFVMKNCPPLLVAAGHGFLANTVSKNLLQ